MRSIKKGDQVKILAGKDRGKTGKVFAVNQKTGRITVEGMNLVTRHERPKKQGEKGQRLKIPMPFDPSNIMLVCPHCGKPTRTSRDLASGGEKTRVCKLCKKRI